MEEDMQKESLSAAEARMRLKEGNAKYLSAETCSGDISPQIRKATCEEGQSPYAVIVTCSDSRVIPESIFMAGIGELFVIRVAGNVMDDHQLGSIEYAVGHLGCKLVVVLGHENCGAVDAAINHDPDGYVKFITDEIRRAIGKERDALRACCLNVEHGVSVIKESLGYSDDAGSDGPQVCGAVYYIGSGEVKFME